MAANGGGATSITGQLHNFKVSVRPHPHLPPTSFILVFRRPASVEPFSLHQRPPPVLSRQLFFIALMIFLWLVKFLINAKRAYEMRKALSGRNVVRVDNDGSLEEVSSETIRMFLRKKVGMCALHC